MTFSRFSWGMSPWMHWASHRIGRTGRAKRHGVAYTFVTDYPGMVRLSDIAKHTRNQIQPVAFGADGRLVPAEAK